MSEMSNAITLYSSFSAQSSGFVKMCGGKKKFKAECRKWLEVDRIGKCFLNMGQDRAIHFHYVIFDSLGPVVRKRINLIQD